MKPTDPINEVIGTRIMGSVCPKHPELNGLRSSWKKCIGCIRTRANERNKAFKKTPEGKEWYAPRIRAQAKIRKLAKIQRVPPWADRAAIAKFYQDRPSGMVVDHIVPLRGVSVSGLHVLNNLQYLTSEQNQEKGNDFSDSSLPA